ncbi:MAG: threonine--tRNA ligase [Pirellulales bacterium]|jgi:threonyl-tRNA synthetase|nr:threonine--tRNA ligase [Pirellulales bacterium]
MPTVRFHDGSTRDYPVGTRLADCLAGAAENDTAARSIAAVLNGKTVGLDAVLPESGEATVELLSVGDPRALPVMRHSAAHVMARAVMKLFDGVELAFGPTVGEGFYYDMRAARPITDEDLPAIEAEMRKIIEADEAFERVEVDREKAVKIVRDLDQPLKVEHIETGLAEHPTLSFYRQGEFVDLCRGPHIPSPGCIGAVKLTSLAGAYWKGDADREQLQRLYGTAWFTQEELDAYLARLEEARKRDHRVLGKQLNLFTTSPLVGSGLVLWMPKGARLRATLESFVRDELAARGYEPVYTPHIGKVDLYKISGHYPYYADSQFKPIVQHEDEQYLLKPMNCPHHTMIYKARPRSYKDLPLRLAEFGTVYRYEQSGELGGMTRVRGFTQDDAHIFCMPEQVEAEVEGCIDFTLKVLESLAFENFRVRLGFRDPNSDKYVGPPERWDEAEAAIERVARRMNLPGCEPEPGEAAFYGPKIDFVVNDSLGREWQLGTVQLDYNLPSKERFDLEYIGDDNGRHTPVMIHRAPLGSMERFVGVLIEHFAGAFPLWLAPEQVRVIPVSAKSEEYAKAIGGKLEAAGLRASIDLDADKLGAKIRKAQLELIPMMMICGPRDEAAGTVSLRDRLDGDIGAMPVDEAITQLCDEVARRAVRHRPKPLEMGTAPAAGGDDY